MTSPAIKTAREVDRERLDNFLRRVYSPQKASFLVRHGEWWHRGQENRWVMEEDGEVVAYYAVIPTALRVSGERVEAAWWVDLVVDSKHRGRGLQRAFDKRVQTAAPLIVGFPNALAAEIHRKHGWGIREDLEVRLLPLRPSAVAERQGVSGVSAAGLRVAAVMAAPIAEWFRRRLENFEPTYSRVLSQPDASEMADVFKKDRDAAAATTFRDAAYLKWRYLDAPYRDELSVVAGGKGDELSVVAVVRVMQRGKGTVARVLDLFGELEDEAIVRDVVRLATRHALSCGAYQVTAMTSNSRISAVLRNAGFLIRSRGRFCWMCDDDSLSSLIGDADIDPVLGDSDNDEP